MIYYIACTATQRIKVGYTRGEPEVRLKQLQTGSASDLRLIACHEGDPEDERKIHAVLAAHRARGEWFTASDEVLAFVSLMVREMVEDALESGQDAPEWMSVWLRALADQNGFIPDELKRLV